MDDDQYPVHSPLEQPITRDGKTVQVEIYEDGSGGWILEVVDEYWNSTVWQESFKSDQAALDEVFRTIEEEGIDSLIGDPPSDSSAHTHADDMQMMVPLSDEEMDELDDFLMSDATSDETMLLDCLDGYLTAIVSSPVLIKPSEWLPGVWGPTAEDEPDFDSFEQTERIIGLIMRHMNSIIWSLQDHPESFSPVFDIAVYPDHEKEYTDGEMWAYGYMRGINLQRHNWNTFFENPMSAEVIRPIYLLGADDVSPEEEELTATPAQREQLSEQIPASVAWIYRFLQPYRHAWAERKVATSYQREYPKIGRNDACPCGSGKKFKKCCGAPTILH